MRTRFSGLALGAALSVLVGSGVAQAQPASASPSSEAPKKPALDVPRAIPAGPSWNLPPGGIDWARLKGKVVLVDFWNQK